ncbi:MAG: ATP-binding protein [Nitrospira sp.]|nr:ATP-binding protein [Nitrospira sp.]
MAQMTVSARMAEAARQTTATLDHLVRQYDKAAPSMEDLASRFINNEPALRAIMSESLADVQGVEGGFYSHQDDRLLGYAFPTYSGSGPKTDIPAAERPAIVRLVQQAILTGSPVQERIEHGSDVILFAAAPLEQDERTVGAVWLMHRLPGIRNPQWHSFSVVLLSLCLFAWAVAWAAWSIARRLDRAIEQIVNSIRTLHDSDSPPISDTGYAEVERIAAAINHLVHTVRLQQSRREQLERQLQQADRLAILGRLVAGVAHEVRNPLSSIRLKLQLARRSPLELERLVTAFNVVEEEIARLDRLVARLLSVAKPTAEVQLTDLNHFLTTRLHHWQARLSDSNLLLKYEGLLDHASQAMIERDRVGQILDNLIANACEATGTDGTILISLTRPDDTSFTITVADSGPGLSLEARHHLFEPFFTTKPRGTGLGLFLSAEMARALGGRLTHLDSPHGGGCFELSLPCKEPTSQTLEETLLSRRPS